MTRLSKLARLAVGLPILGGIVVSLAWELAKMPKEERSDLMETLLDVFLVGDGMEPFKPMRPSEVRPPPACVPVDLGPQECSLCGVEIPDEDTRSPSVAPAAKLNGEPIVRCRKCVCTTWVMLVEEPLFAILRRNRINSGGVS